MNCLHCGKQLALLRKFREDSFCCSEHKELFVESHQTLALERLKISLRRIKERRHLLLNPPAEPEPASCGFLSQPVTFEIHNSPFGSLTGFENLEFDLLLQPPTSSGTSPSTSVILSPASPLSAPYPIAAGAAFIGITAEPVVWSSPSLFAAPGTKYESTPLLAPAPIASASHRAQDGWKPLDNERTAPQDLRSQMEAPGFSSEPLAPSYSEAASAGTVLSGIGRMLRLRKPGAINQFEKTQALEPAPLPRETGSSPALSGSAPTDFPAPTVAPQMVERLFKARPRNAVADASLPEFVEIQAEPQSAPGRPAMGNPAIASNASNQPLATGRVANPRTERPVDGRTAPMNHRAYDSLQSAGNPSIRGTQNAPVREAAAAPMVPPLADRFFKARPRGPVQGLSIPGWDPIDPGQPVIESSGPGFDSLELHPSLQAQPVLLDRVYRMRPRGPVPDRTHLAQDSRTELSAPPVRSAAESVPFTPAAQLPEASAIESAAAPSFCDRLFRPRPRAGIADPSLPSFRTIEPSAYDLTGDAAVQSLPASMGDAGVLPLSASTSMAPLPVSSGASAKYSEAFAQQVSRSAHLSPGTASADADLAPTFLDRMFRPRPRAGVADPALPSFEQLAPEPVDLTADGLTENPSLPVQADNDLSPTALDRLFRPRPKAGVANPALPSFRQLTPEPVNLTGDGLTENPSLPVQAESDLAPAALDKLFRPRPKAGVADPAMASFRRLEARSVDAEPNGLASRPNLPQSAQDSLALTALDKLFRPRPRAGVAGGAAFTAIDASGVESTQNSLAYPATSLHAEQIVLGGEFSLPLVDRLFRPRPRAGVADAKLPAFHPIEPGTPEGSSVAYCYPEMPAQLMRQARVTRERPIRMKPRVAGSTNGSVEEEETLPEKRSARQVS
jgi:hypothetical protein